MKASDALRTEIVNLLGDSLSFDSNLFETTVEIIFTVNTRGELVIISTNATDKSTETAIKRRLNYKKVDFKSNKLIVFIFNRAMIFLVIPKIQYKIKETIGVLFITNESILPHKFPRFVLLVATKLFIKYNIDEMRVIWILRTKSQKG